MKIFVKRVFFYISVVTVFAILCLNCLFSIKPNVVNADNFKKLEKTVLNVETIKNLKDDFDFYGAVLADEGRGKVIVSDGATATTKGETKFFNLFAEGVESKRFRLSFGMNYAEIDSEKNKIIISVGGIKTEILIDKRTDLSEYSLYMELENGKYTEAVVNDKYVHTYSAGGIKIGLAGTGEAEYKFFDIAAEREIEEFSYGKISVEAFGKDASFKEIKIFPFDTGYVIENRDYDEKDDEIIRVEKPEQLTEKQKKQKNAFIAIVSVCGVVAAGLILAIIVIIAKKRTKKRR